MVDASVALRLLLDRSVRAAELLRGDLVAAPTTIVPEVLSGLATQVQAGILSRTVATALFAEFRNLGIDVVPAEALGPETLAVAADLRLSAYDASYVALAERLRAILATADKRMAARYVHAELVV